MPETESGEQSESYVAAPLSPPAGFGKISAREKASAKYHKPLNLVMTPKLAGIILAAAVWVLLSLGLYVARDQWLTPMMPEIIHSESLQMMIIDQVQAKVDQGKMTITGVYQNLTEDDLTLPPLRLHLIMDVGDEVELGIVQPSESNVKAESAVTFTAEYKIPKSVAKPEAASLQIQFLKNPVIVDR